MAVEAVNQGKTIVDQACPSGDAVKALFTKSLELLKA
jgi:hypothetical protein